MKKKRIVQIFLLGMFLLVATTINAATITGGLISLGDTDSDGLFNYQLDYTVMNNDPSLSIEEVIVYFKDLNYSEIAFLSTPADWVDTDVMDPLSDGVGNLTASGSADAWTGDSAGYAPIAPGASLGGFSVTFESTLLNSWDPAHFEGELWYDDWTDTPWDATYEVVGLDLTFTPFDDPDDPDVIPEPTSILLFGAGLCAFCLFSRRSREANTKNWQI